MRWLVAVSVLLLPHELRAQPGVAEQQALAKRLGEKVQRFEM